MRGTGHSGRRRKMSRIGSKVYRRVTRCLQLPSPDPSKELANVQYRGTLPHPVMLISLRLGVNMTNVNSPSIDGGLNSHTFAEDGETSS